VACIFNAKKLFHSLCDESGNRIGNIQVSKFTDMEHFLKWFDEVLKLSSTISAKDRRSDEKYRLKWTGRFRQKMTPKEAVEADNFDTF
jgi:hypothetical protein